MTVFHNLILLEFKKITNANFVFLVAEEQEKVQKVINALKSQVVKRDNEIKLLQRALKEAETVMVCFIEIF